MNQVMDTVVAALAEMSGRSADEVTPETTISSLGLDSLDFVELTLIIEGELDIRLDPEDFGELVTVQDAVAVIEATATLAA